MLLIRHFDNAAEVLIASALADAARRGLGPICVFLSFSPANEDVRTLLDDPRVASVGVKDLPLETKLPADLSEDPRVGRYWEPGGWTLPVPAKDVYFIGPWRLITMAMLREAIRCELISFRVRIVTFWAPVPLRMIRAMARLPQPLRAAIFGMHRVPLRLWSAGRRLLARIIRFIRPDAIALAARISGGESLRAIPLEAAFRHMLRAAAPSSGAVPGRIVHVCGNLQPGGAERQLVYVLRGLAQRNFESVRLLCHSLRPDTHDRRDFHLNAVRAIGIEAREIRRRGSASPMPPGLREVASALPSGLLTDILDLYWEFIETKPEIVHAWLDWDNVRSGLAAALAGVPRIVLSGRNINPSHFALYQPYMDPAYRVLSRHDNVTFVNNSRAGANDYADWIGIPRERIRVVHNGVDAGAWTRASDGITKALRATLGIPDDAFVVGGVFRLEAEKRPFLWIDTAVSIAQHLPGAWFVIFGQGSLREQIRTASVRSGISDRLVIPGLTEDVLSVMSAIDVLLLTSSGEGLPNVLLEAQSSGTPVVTTDVGGAGEAIDPCETGWAIASGRADDLAQQVVWLYAHPEVRSAVRDRGPAFVRRQFGVERMVCETAALYNTTEGPTVTTGRAQ
jgi:glycosyltransferase involved in cell wall biosynthesis